MAHLLKIIIEDIQQDPNYIKAIDWSVYDTKLPVTNRVMKVNVPGHNTSRIITFSQSGSNTYSSKSLKLSKQIEVLPDGLWTFTYSVCPNEKKFTVYNHFRTVELTNKLMSLIAKPNDFSSANRELPEACMECLLMIKSLKTNTLDRYNLNKAYDLYNDTDRIITYLIKKYN